MGYYIGNSEYGIALTIADNSYMNLMSVSLLNFKDRKFHTKSYMQFLSNGKVGLPGSSKKGDACFKSKNCEMNFYNDGNERHLVCNFKNLYNNQDFTCDVILTETNESSMVIATPFNKQKHFYYNQKINCLKAKGVAIFDGKTYSMDDCYGVLDWGRGVWTYSNTWYWSSMSGEYNNERIGSRYSSNEIKIWGSDTFFVSLPYKCKNYIFAFFNRILLSAFIVSFILSDLHILICNIS